MQKGKKTKIIYTEELRDGIAIGFKDMILVGTGKEDKKNERTAATDVHNLSK